MKASSKSAKARPLSLRYTSLAALVAAALTCNAAAAEGDEAEDKEKKDNVSTLDQITVIGERQYTSPVTVGGKVPLTLREIPNSVSVITQRRIEDQNLITVEDALRYVTGVTATPNDGTQSQYRARGFTLAVMNDGVPAYSALSGYQQLDLAVFERLEVLRGPAGVLQGSGEPGGVLNVVKKRGQSEFALSSALTVGTWDNYRATVDIGGPLNDEGSLRGRFVALAHNRDYSVDVVHDEKVLGYGILNWDIGDSTTLGLSVTYQDTDTTGSNGGLPAWTTGGLLDVPRSTTVAQEWEKYIWETRDYALDIEHRFSNEWVAKASVSQRDQRFFFKDAFTSDGVRPSDNTVPYTRRENDYDYTRKAVDLFFSGPFNLFGRRHSLLFGYNSDSLDTEYGGVTAPTFNIGLGAGRVPFDRPDLVPDFDLPYNTGGLTETRQSGFYAQGRFSLSDPLTLVLGGRLSDFDVRTRTQPPGVLTAWRQTFKRNDEFTPYGGILYDLGKTYSLYASYADIFVPQSSTLLKADGSGLDPRIGKQYEVGAKAEYFEGRLNASLAVFRLRDTGRSLADPDNPGFYVNAGEVGADGWELEVAGTLGPGYEVQIGYTRLDTEWLTAAAALQGLKFDAWEPKHSFKFWAVRRWSEGQDSGLTLGLGFNTLSGTEAGTGTSAVRSQGGNTVINAMAAYRFNPKFSLVLNANNLTDKVYYSRLGGTNSYNTYGDPRNYSLTARLSF